MIAKETSADIERQIKCLCQYESWPRQYNWVYPFTDNHQVACRECGAQHTEATEIAQGIFEHGRQVGEREFKAKLRSLVGAEPSCG